MSDIKKCFVSRFPEGYIVEADYSQLEVIALAYLSGDTQLRYDLTHGVDMHSENAEKLFGPTFTPAQRKIAKALSFQLQYGAGYKSMAAANNIPEAVAKDFIDIYYRRYPKVGTWQANNLTKVTMRRRASAYKTTTGLPAGVSFLNSLTGRVYGFIEGDSYEGGKTSFRPTQIKNYPVQGLATGDIVPMMVGRLNRELLSQPPHFQESVKLINTVHDSVVLDVASTHLDNACRIVKNVLENAPQVFEEVFGKTFDLPLPVEVSYGSNWGELIKYDI